MAGCLATSLFVHCGAAEATELGDRIAESLCYPASASALELSRADAALYTATATFDGGYRDTEGPDARAWFTKSASRAECRRPADWQLTLFFCAPVSYADGVLTKSRPRLCS